LPLTIAALEEQPFPTLVINYDSVLSFQANSAKRYAVLESNFAASKIYRKSPGGI
jgi:hypothetical protein